MAKVARLNRFGFQALERRENAAEKFVPAPQLMISFAQIGADPLTSNRAFAGSLLSICIQRGAE
jgi:hypothetical protein